MTDQNADLNTSELTSNVDVQCVECAEKIKLDARNVAIAALTNVATIGGQVQLLQSYHYW